MPLKAKTYFKLSYKLSPRTRLEKCSTKTIIAQHLKNSITKNYNKVTISVSHVPSIQSEHPKKIIETPPNIPAYLPQQKFYFFYFSIFDVHAKYAKYDAKANYKRNIKSGHLLVPLPVAQAHLERAYPHKAHFSATANYSTFSRIWQGYSSASLHHFGTFPHYTFALIIFNFGKYSALSHYLLNMFKWGCLRDTHGMSES